MDLQLECGVHPDEHSLENRSTRSTDLQPHILCILYAIKFRILGMHVHVPECADDAFVHFEEAGRSHQHPARRALDISRKPQWNLKPQRDCISIRQLDLIDLPAWP